MTAGVAGSEIRWYSSGWSCARRGAGLFSGAVLVQPCVFGGRRDRDTPNRERWVTETEGAASPQGCSLAEGGGGPGAAAGGLRSRRSFLGLAAVLS